ncbi:PIN domain-containing protein [Candidatus Poriferisodalis sp.]|uniref:PIN domain-containing protein n=1 Tax=Candidatus Poriferisodalis sp. TaxID=3101277 RepID=UPI003D106FCC
MSLLLDTGALISLERNDPDTWAFVRFARQAGRPLMTHGGVVAQVWRGGFGRQARLAAALRGTRVAPLDDVLGRSAGVLLARSGLDDAIDAALVALCSHGDEILTSDPGDLAALAEAARLDVDVIPV